MLMLTLTRKLAGEEAAVCRVCNQWRMFSAPSSWFLQTGTIDCGVVSFCVFLFWELDLSIQRSHIVVTAVVVFHAVVHASLSLYNMRWPPKDIVCSATWTGVQFNYTTGKGLG
ncbi:hypothetical protein FN846DRAFT_936512 [Sphaerosporella brunnea]|uniref:Uncharacterized protein n=1 Tax=Sphaerosporella brunnea TaxID=1250544 RepID=A0A5J5F4A1_9PEZI|nr:hypothetical protein FN846DRAFT_936512 [Sphaerosporella brunnea]